jgi:hypothetical protein
MPEILARQRPAAEGYVFAMPSKPTQHVSRHLAADWLKRAYCLAGVEKQRGSLWHAFRRKWATERKHYPIVDVAAAGGWKDLTTSASVTNVTSGSC